MRLLLPRVLRRADDPRFTDGDSNYFYFHGNKDRDFCILSDTAFHINANFIGSRNVATGRDSASSSPTTASTSLGRV